MKLRRPILPMGQLFHAPFQNSGTPVRCASAQTSIHVQSGACGVCVGHAFDEAGNCPRMWSANHKSTLDSLKAQIIRRTKSHLRIGGETTLQTYDLRINIFGESLLEYSPSFKSDFLPPLAGLEIVLHTSAQGTDFPSDSIFGVARRSSCLISDRMP